MANGYTARDIWQRREQAEVVAQAEANAEGRFDLRFEKFPAREIDAVYILARAPHWISLAAAEF